MSAHHYAARHLELPLAMYIAERVYGVVTHSANLLHSFSKWREHRSAVERLAALDEHLLRDIGIENRHLIDLYVRRARC